MGENSSIEWTDHTWNPWIGCLKVSPGCKQCYMYRDQVRYGNDPKDVHRTSDATFYKPLRWKEPAKVFTCSWSDFFIEAADPWRDAAWDVIRQTPHLTYQILTKRPENIADRLPDDWDQDDRPGYPNVWLGVSVESRLYRWRIGVLSDIPAVVRFVSYEPALGPVSFAEELSCHWIDWVISGGESGYAPRPAELDWFRRVRDECAEHGVAYFHKQHGGRSKIDGTWGGRLLDGRTWDQFPRMAMEPR